MYYVSEDIKDERFFDNFQLCEQRPECNCNWIVYNEWLVHSIYHYGKVSRIMLVFQYRLALEISQPRLLVFSVDVAEGVAVAFDSYPKADGSRKSEYKHKSNQKQKEIVHQLQ